MLEGNHRRVDYSVVPSAVFTLPPLASVGLREDEAREKGLSFRVHCRQTAAWYVNRRVNEEAAGFKILIEDGSRRILGAHIPGPQSAELINLFHLFFRAGLTADTKMETILAYPNSASNPAVLMPSAVVSI